MRSALDEPGAPKGGEHAVHRLRRRVAGAREVGGGGAGVEWNATPEENAAVGVALPTP
jgi:hypothetical protein